MGIYKRNLIFNQPKTSLFELKPIAQVSDSLILITYLHKSCEMDIPVDANLNEDSDFIALLYIVLKH